MLLILKMNVPWCLSHCSVGMKTYHDQSNSRESNHLAGGLLTSSGVQSIFTMSGSMVAGMVTMVLEKSLRVLQSSLQARGRHQAWHGLCETSKPNPRNALPPTRPPLLTLSNGVTPWWLSVQHMSLWGPFLVTPQHLIMQGKSVFLKENTLLWSCFFRRAISYSCPSYGGGGIGAGSALLH